MARWPMPSHILGVSDGPTTLRSVENSRDRQTPTCRWLLRGLGIAGESGQVLQRQHSFNSPAGDLPRRKGPNLMGETDLRLADGGP